MAEETCPPVAVVVVNWNNYADTARCLRSLDSLDYPDVETVVVDNGSTDESGSRLEAEFDCVRFVFNRRNRGFGGGCNAGIDAALADGAEYVFLLNNDATVEPPLLERLVAAAEDSGAGVVGARIEDRAGHAVNGSRCYYPDMLFYSGYRERLPFGTATQEAADAPWWTTDRIEGAGVLLPRWLLEERQRTRGFYLDDSLFMYGEEVELAMWCRERAVESVVAGDAVVTHGGEGSSDRAFQLYYLTRNRPSIAREYLPAWRWLAYALLYAGWRLGLAGVNGLHGEWDNARAILSGLTDGLRCRTGRDERY